MTIEEENEIKELRNLLTQIQIGDQQRARELIRANQLIESIETRRSLREPPVAIGRAVVDTEGSSEVTFDRTTVSTTDTGSEKSSRGWIRSISGLSSRSKKKGQGLVKGSDLALNEWVTVLNPKPGQPIEGKIVGRTRDNLLKVQGEGTSTENGETVTQIIRRAPFNLQRQQE